MKRKIIIYISLIFFVITQSQAVISNNKKPAKRNPLHMVYMPPGFKLISAKKINFNRKNVNINLYAKNFSQGNAVYAEVYSNEMNKDNFQLKTFKFGKSTVPMTEKSWGYRGIFGISPKSKPGKKKIRISYMTGETVRNLAYTIKVTKTKFPVYRRPLDLGKYSDARKRTPEEKAFIKRSAVKKKKAFRHRGKDLLTGIFSHPRDMHHVTSPYWSKRVYMRYKKVKGKKIRLKNSSSVHRGLDLRGETGTPVFAMANGEIVLAEELYYEGFMVIIDHGNGLFSYFMHMNDVSVKKNDKIKAGDIVGHVGSTGVSTAAHLHVAMTIRGIHVDPLSILPLPVRD